MPVAIEMSFRGATLDQYDEILEKMNLTPGGVPASGALFHWATKTDEGIHVVDVWETKEQFERFAEEQIGPYAREVGIEGAPEMRFYDVHAYLTAG
jgi:hypothetical protein